MIENMKIVIFNKAKFTGNNFVKIKLYVNSNFFLRSFFDVTKLK